MTLAPGEKFEHTHQGESTTTLLTGSVDIVVDGVRTALPLDQPIPVPPHVNHVLINVGDVPAVLECVHRIDQHD